MADTKITALTAITTVDPAVDVLPIVDVSDTTMAASGTTKKITSNQILGAGGTATLASATITGDLTVDTSTLKVDSANNRVGINKASPAYALDVVGNATISATAGNNNWFYIAGNGNTVGSTSFDIGQSSSNEGYVFNRANGPIIFGVNNSTAMTLNSTGLGVGVSPATKLDVRGTINGNQAIFTGTVNRGLIISTRSDGLADDRTVILNAQHSTGAQGQLVLQTVGTDRLLIDSSGNVGIGVTPSGSGGCLQLKSGITFPATQVASSDANTLDDYEEGTWTIVVNNQLGNSATIASQIARYVKIGRRVFVFGDFTLSAKGAAAAGNIVYLGNLPFVPNSTLFEGSVVHKYDNVNLTTNGQINIISAAGGNNVCFFPISSATTGTSNLTFGQITDTTRLVFNFSYDV